jgi:DNA-binding CsgD family transcriptional regulator/tetratricopeptide (TPR) repeat protein/type II secretory pathway predicted ATPase ExeA
VKHPHVDGYVGRREELALLHDEFTAACDGRARFVSIEGEAGIGKSRLVSEFLSSVESEASVLSGHCSEHVRSPYLPLLSVLPDLDTSAKRATLFEAAARTLERSGRRRPVVAVIEDLQWADSASLEMLRYLLAHLQDARVLVLVTLRVDDAARNPALAAFRLAASRTRIEVCRLHGLRRNEIRRLIQQSVHANAMQLAPETISQIEQLSEGNPLFAEELTRIAIESGSLSLATHVPLSAQAMLSERLTPLSIEDRETLTRAAILGQRFEVGFLAKIAARSLDDVLGTMQRATTAGLVIAEPGSLTGFAFRHALIRQALADQLILGLAAPLHVRIAQELESLPDAAERAAELAYHWSVARVSDKARFYCERAAEAAWNVYAYRDAMGFYSDALRWEYPPGPARAAVYERLGTLLYIDGCGEIPGEWFERARDEHASLGNVAESARALLMLADQYWVDGRTTESLEAASRAEALVPPGYDHLAASAQLSLARFYVTLGDWTRAHEHLEAAAKLHEHFDTSMEANFHEVRGEAYAAAGDAARALADCGTASRLAQVSGVSELITQIENNFAMVAADLGEISLAIERHEISLAEARRTSMTWRVAYSALNYAGTLTTAGRLARARDLVWEALESGVTTATFQTKAATVGIPLALLLNDRSLLESCATDAALAFAFRSGEAQRIGSVTTAFAELRTAQGALGEARALLTRALDAMPRAHRNWSLFAYAARQSDDGLRKRAQHLLARSSGRSRMRRAHRLLFVAPHLAARAFRALDCPLYEAFALEAAGRAPDALDVYRDIGDVRDAERLRTAEPVAKAPLSARQLDVARLVATGETNKSIAQRLHISVHTVEHHLTGIFARLGIRSRSQLAARIGDLAMAEIQDTPRERDSV